MENAKVFISHSHKDGIIATALVELLIKLGLDNKKILASSSPKTQLHAGAPLYAELRAALSNKNTLVVFLLSDHFYSSTVCMNEMGAAWVTGLKSYFMVLPGFSFDKVEGVILENSPIGISLSSFNDSNKTRLEEMCAEIVRRYSLSYNEDTIKLGLLRFSSAIDEYKNQLLGKTIFSMEKAKSFCINDTDSDGCRIWKRESSNSKTTVILDFTQTTSKLCSVVYRVEQQNWKPYKESGKILCFEIYSDAEPFQSEVELHFADHNESTHIMITDDTKTCRIPLSMFDSMGDDWEIVKEVCFLFRKKHVDHRITVVVENLRLE